MWNAASRQFFLNQAKPYPYATGGDYVYLYEEDGKTYRVHEFLSTGTNTLNVEVGGRMDVLVVGGGGSGGRSMDQACGGGGAGAFVEHTATIASGTYTVTVGSGGAAVTANAARGNNGGNSLFTGIGIDVIATGGGGGGSAEYTGLKSGNSGGSGGGGGNNGTGGSASSYSDDGTKYGNAGGSSSAGGAGGGGGAGAAGQSIFSATGGNGGNGRQWLNGTTYAGGGGGSGSRTNTTGSGGSGGGGNGGRPANAATNGAANTGSGGGGQVNGDGSWTALTTNPSGSGGSGIVIVRYVIAEKKLWTPSEISDLSVWLDANDIALNNNDTVSTWENKGTGGNTSQSDSAKRPLFKTNILNGKPGVRYDGSNDCLQISSLALNTYISVFLVAKTTTGKPFFVEQGVDSNSNDGFYFYGTSGNHYNVRRTNRNSYGGTSSWFGSAAAQAGLIINAISSAPNPMGKVYKNGTVQADGSASLTNSLSDSSVTATLNIGARNNGAVIPMDGDLHELIVYNKPLPTTDRQRLEGYLAHKWGLTNNLPSGHPYKYEPPYKVEPEEIVTDGLVLNLDAGDYASYPRSGTNWYDISGNGNHVTLYNGITYSDGALVGNSASSAYGRTNNTLNLSSTNKITVFSIFKDPTPLNPRILYEHTDNWNTVNSNYGGFGLSCNSDGGNYVEKGLHFQLRGNVGYSGRNTYSPNLSNYQVYTTVYDFSQTVGDNETKNYINGEIVTTTLGSTYNANNTGSFGNDYLYLWSRGGSTSFNDGKLARLIIYNRALSSTEIQQNYNALRGRYGITPTYTPSIVADGLVLNLDAGDPASYSGSGSTWYDLSGNNYHQTLVSTSRVVVDGTYGFNFTGAGRAVDAGTTVTHGDSHTLIAWARPLADSQVSTWRTLWRDSPNDHPLLIQDGTNLIGYYDNNTTSFISYGLNLGTLGLENKWTMFTIVASGGVSTLYINDGSITGSVNYTSSGNAQDTIGNTSTGTQPFGYVGAAQIYNRALSSTEIQQNFNALRGRYGI